MLTVKLIDTKDGNNQYEGIYIGDGFTEGIADIIASIAMNENTADIEGSYDIEAAELQIFIDALNINLNDLIDKGVYGLINKMEKNGIYSHTEYIDNIDILVKIRKYNEFETCISAKDNIKNFLVDLAKCRINNGESKEETIKFICEVLDNCGYESIPEIFPAPEPKLSEVENSQIRVIYFNNLEELKKEIIQEIEQFTLNDEWLEGIQELESFEENNKLLQEEMELE